jgi:hypothetical protein
MDFVKRLHAGRDRGVLLDITSGVAFQEILDGRSIATKWEAFDGFSGVCRKLNTG